jgi:PTS system nitrogen regulatory IIA component
MEIADLLLLNGVVDDLKAGSKKQALQELAAIAAPLTDLHERVIFDVLLERERLGSTGVGAGVAIPHGKLPDLKKLSSVFARLREPIEFEAIDERPVDLIFLLLAPESAGADHLKALARISRLLRDDGVCERLRGADNAEALYAVLTDPEEASAA